MFRSILRSLFWGNKMSSKLLIRNIIWRYGPPPPPGGLATAVPTFIGESVTNETPNTRSYGFNPKLAGGMQPPSGFPRITRERIGRSSRNLVYLPNLANLVGTTLAGYRHWWSGALPRRTVTRRPHGWTAPPRRTAPPVGWTPRSGLCEVCRCPASYGIASHLWIPSPICWWWRCSVPGETSCGPSPVSWWVVGRSD